MHAHAGIPAVTRGEDLFHWLANHQKAHCGTSRIRGQRVLALSGRPSGFGDYVEGLVLSHAFARILTAAKSIFGRSNPVEVAISELRSYLGEWLYWLMREDLNRLVRLTKLACEASDRPISKGVQRSIWHGRSVHRCYICGSLLAHSPSTGKFEDSAGTRAELEHLWPAAYGGDSIEENLLPSCSACNKNKKELISWESGYIHSLMFPMDFSSHAYYVRLPRAHKILLHRRAGFEIARREQLTLKRAFQRLGPYHDVVAIDKSDTWDFFNMESHSATYGERLWQPS
jgi:5-methylcytosine-specific restriction endonuclease McrA